MPGGAGKKARGENASEVQIDSPRTDFFLRKRITVFFADRGEKFKAASRKRDHLTSLREIRTI